MVAPDEQTRDVRHDQTQKADRPDDGRRDGRESHRDDRDDNAAARDVHAEAARRLVLEGEEVALPRHEQGRDQPDGRVERERAEVVPRLLRDVGVDDARHAGVIAPRAGVERAHQPREHRVDRDADENDPQRRQAALPRQAVDQREGQHAAKKREKRREEIQRREKRRHQHRREARARADADDAGVGQRIFHHRLQQHARHRRGGPAEQSDEDARKAQVIDRGDVRVILHEQPPQKLRGRDVQAARIDRPEQQRQKRRRREEKSPHPPASRDQGSSPSFLMVVKAGTARRAGGGLSLPGCVFAQDSP